MNEPREREGPDTDGLLDELERIGGALLQVVDDQRSRAELQAEGMDVYHPDDDSRAGGVVVG